MNSKAKPFQVNSVWHPVWTSGLVVAAFLAGGTVQDASAETHQVRDRGTTLVEAESYLAVSEVPPKIEPSERCSGNSNLEYFWANSWFELEIETPRMLNYRMSLRAASDKGTQIEVQRVDGAGKAISLATIDVPGSGSYTDYQTTRDVAVSLPSGLHRLRFENVSQGVNVDYITFSAGAIDDIVTVNPVATDGPDINPLKGFNTGWWRNENYASVGFQYIEWGKLEPQDDLFDWDYVEKEVLAREGTRGRHMILQFVVDWDYREPVDSNYLGPAWLREMVGEVSGIADPKDSKSRQMRATPYNDPVFIEEAIEAIGALCDHYKDDPRTFVIQVGVLGFWGEWHTFPREDWSPTASTKQVILNTYLNDIGKDGLTQVRYPDDPICFPRKGMGYTNGTATLSDHGYEFGDAIERRKLWKNGPVGGEWPPNVELNLWERFFQTDEGERFIRTARYSTLLPPEPKEIAEKLPSWNQDRQFMKMHRLMGYNFQATAVRHLVSADDSGLAHIEVDLHNTGIAPFYKKWSVQLAVLNAKTLNVVGLVETDTDLRLMGPGDSITLAGSCIATLDPREEYQIGLRILQTDADEFKASPWKLDARNVYVVLANDVKVMDGQWKESETPQEGWKLQGGWNMLGEIEFRLPNEPQSVEDDFFPLQGSFRP
ncbi:carbohydrate-binding protein [Rubripirellula tenax]|nr:carbohydrate-binding protein [Rubripirellula tenax]